MNRSNIGNVITNGMQILSVAGTTAAYKLGRADKVLNNMTKEQQDAYYKMQADKRIEQTKMYNAKTDNPFRRLNEDEQSEYRDYQADKMRKAISDNLPDTDQAPEIRLKRDRDVEWLEFEASMTENEEDLKAINELIAERRKTYKGGDNNANG